MRYDDPFIKKDFHFEIEFRDSKYFSANQHLEPKKFRISKFGFQFENSLRAPLCAECERASRLECGSCPQQRRVVACWCRGDFY
jgi:hypothetical protein